MCDIEIRLITADQTIDLRHRVLWPQSDRASMVLPDDATAIHVGAFLDRDLIGVGSFFPDGDRVRLRKLAVYPANQGQGVASAMMRFSIELLQNRGFRTLWCDARVTAAGFYATLGFSMETEIFIKKGLDYVMAELAL